MTTIRDPVIVLGAPRSGTGMLFETLARSSHLWSLADESHDVLEGPYHPERHGWNSNALTATDLDQATATRLREDFARRIRPGSVRRAKQDRRRQGAAARRLPNRLRYALARAGATVRAGVAGGAVRLLEKTPKNCLRIPFLRALFPDARFVFLRRDGRATIASLIDGWQSGRFETYRLPEPLRIAGYRGDAWCFLLPQGWRNLTKASLAQVCAAQWAAAVAAMLDTLPGLRAEGRAYELAYEDLVSRPRATLEPLFEFLGLPLERGILADDGRLPMVNVVSTPSADKWRERHAEEVARVLPEIASLQTTLGYELT